MISPKAITPISEEGFQRFQQPQNDDSKPRKGKPWCDHCCKHGHTKEPVRRSTVNLLIGNHPLYGSLIIEKVMFMLLPPSATLFPPH